MPSKLADAFRSHPVDIQPKNLHDLKELPDSYQWSADQDRPEPEPAHHEPVPVIDLSDPNALEEIGHACTTWGVFQVVNHGVPAAVLDRMEDVAKSFFSLPAHQKLKAARSPDGISGYGLARISSFFPKLMWSEGFTMVGSPLEHFHTIWPHHYTRFWISIAYLHGPPSNVRISPVQKLVGPSQPQMYRAVTWTEYLGTKAKHFDKALSSVRLCAAAEAKDHNNNNNNNGVQVG
ncbi:unnamed protein product [Linum tenue]|uniref:Non-haem dioxygenase N-terminal domain-containing protein n=1 Tax=Linum tenue TaxID=586396 RepID=A0AAV0PTJ5_9ROSI|nr:unnamed protein product [Linum tenue]